MFRFSSEQTIERPQRTRSALRRRRHPHHPDWMELVSAKELDPDMTRVGARGVTPLTCEAALDIDMEVATGEPEADRLAGAP